jgi:putative restriction endonuclease
VADLAEEFTKREDLMHALAAEFAQNAVLTSRWLGRVDFGFGPERVKDVGKGIWNPSSYAGTLTIVSDPDSEYDDGDHGDSLYRYSYEKRPPGQDPRGGSNIKLREAMRLGLPIVMLRKIADGRFVPVMPVYVVKEEPEHRRFLLALDESLRFLPDPAHLTEDQRRYVERVVRQRMHQPEFRSRVLGAYELKCAVCDLKKTPLLDAAHITADIATDGLPVVSNGLALCKIHHAAYDENILGISPDYVVHINDDVLTEVDGPMLKYGLQQMDRRPLRVPRRATQQPDKDRLAQRFEAFRSAG